MLIRYKCKNFSRRGQNVPFFVPSNCIFDAFLLLGNWHTTAINTNTIIYANTIQSNKDYNAKNHNIVKTSIRTAGIGIAAGC